MLTITSRDITWVTPFSRCRTSRYTIVDQQDGPDGLRVTYQLQRLSSGCRYSVLVLTHRPDADRDNGWNVVGYPPLESAMRRNKGDELGCYLYRPTVGK